MNDEARELLVAAALRGHKQASHVFHDHNGGDCPLGLLHVVLHGDRGDAIACTRAEQGTRECAQRLLERFGMSEGEWGDIIRATDYKGWDYLTIARKIGRDYLTIARIDG